MDEDVCSTWKKEEIVITSLDNLPALQTGILFVFVLIVLNAIVRTLLEWRRTK